MKKKVVLIDWENHEKACVLMVEMQNGARVLKDRWHFLRSQEQITAQPRTPMSGYTAKCIEIRLPKKYLYTNSQ